MNKECFSSRCCLVASAAAAYTVSTCSFIPFIDRSKHKTCVYLCVCVESHKLEMERKTASGRTSGAAVYKAEKLLASPDDAFDPTAKLFARSEREENEKERAAVSQPSAKSQAVDSAKASKIHIPIHHVPRGRSLTTISRWDDSTTMPVIKTTRSFTSSTHVTVTQV